MSTVEAKTITSYIVFGGRSCSEFKHRAIFLSRSAVSCCIVAQLFSSVLHSCTLFISCKACHMRGACRPTQTSVRLSVEPTTSCCPSVRPSALPAQRLATWTSQHSCISSRNQDFCRLLLRRLRWSWCLGLLSTGNSEKISRKSSMINGIK